MEERALPLVSAFLCISKSARVITTSAGQSSRSLWKTQNQGDQVIEGWLRWSSVGSGSTIPSTVGTSSVAATVQHTPQRKSFYANGLYWVFYFAGIDVVYKTSSNGTTWSSSSVAVPGATEYVRPSHFSVYTDGTYAYLVWSYGDAGSGYPVRYRRGTISGSSITWGTIYTVRAGQSGVYCLYPSVVANSNGLPFVIVARGSGGSSNGIFAYRCSNSDGSGTWTETLFSSVASGWQTPAIVALTGGKVYALYAEYQSQIVGRLWDGSAWSSQEQGGLGSVSTIVLVLK